MIRVTLNLFYLVIFLQKPGVPLSRGTLITHCYSDLSFMDFICTLVTRSIEVTSPTLVLSMASPAFSFQEAHGSFSRLYDC